MIIWKKFWRGGRRFLERFAWRRPIVLVVQGKRRMPQPAGLAGLLETRKNEPAAGFARPEDSSQNSHFLLPARDQPPTFSLPRDVVEPYSRSREIPLARVVDSFTFALPASSGFRKRPA